VLVYRFGGGGTLAAIVRCGRRLVEPTGLSAFRARLRQFSSIPGYFGNANNNCKIFFRAKAFLMPGREFSGGFFPRRGITPEMAISWGRPPAFPGGKPTNENEWTKLWLTPFMTPFTFLPYSWHDPSSHGVTYAIGLVYNDSKNVVTFVDGHVSYIKMFCTERYCACLTNPPAGYDYQWSPD